MQIESRGFLLVFLLGVLIGLNLLLLALQRVGLEILYKLSPSIYGAPPLVFLEKLLAWLGMTYVIVLVIWGSAMGLFGVRRRACKREWDKRYPLGIDVREAELAVANGEADWVLILSTRFLPAWRDALDQG